MILVIQITSSEALKVKEKHSNSEIKQIPHITESFEISFAETHIYHN